MRTLSRRRFVSAAVASLTVFARSAQAAEFTFVQFHNQPSESSLHRRLVEMWKSIGVDTGGRVEASVFAENRGIPGSDPEALRMLMSGEIQFFTLMGGILANIVPAAEVQQIPFAFASAAAAHRAMDGALGAYLRQEMASRGLHGFAVGAFDNGMRQIAAIDRPVRHPRDLVGMKMRIPAGQIFEDTFRGLGAQTITVNVADLGEALRTRRVDAQENPLAVIDLFKLDTVVRYVSLTNHMWSGFNLLAHLGTWQRLPAAVTAAIDRNVTRYVKAQRDDQGRLNQALERELARRGLLFNTVDQRPFQEALAPMYARWKERLGQRCWSLLPSRLGG